MGRNLRPLCTAKVCPTKSGMMVQARAQVLTTFFSPAVQIGPGERTGKFRLGKEQVVKDKEGVSKISYDDYAIAMVDELERGKHLKGRFTIGY